MGGGRGSGWRSGLGGQGGCERRIEVLVKIEKKNWGCLVGGRGLSGWGVRVDVNEELNFLGKFTKKIRGVSGGWGSGGGSGWWGGGQGGCERRIEVFVEIQKKIVLGGVFGGGLGRGSGLGGGGLGREGGWVERGSGGGSGWWGFRVDVNAMLAVVGDVGYGGCEPRIEGIVQCIKRYCTILRKLKKWGGGRGRGRGNI